MGKATIKEEEKEARWMAGRKGKKNNSIWVTDKEAKEKKKYASLGASF